MLPPCGDEYRGLHSSVSRLDELPHFRRLNASRRRTTNVWMQCEVVVVKPSSMDIFTQLYREFVYKTGHLSVVRPIQTKINA